MLESPPKGAASRAKETIDPSTVSILKLRVHGTALVLFKETKVASAAPTNPFFSRRLGQYCEPLKLIATQYQEHLYAVPKTQETLWGGYPTEPGALAIAGIQDWEKDPCLTFFLRGLTRIAPISDLLKLIGIGTTEWWTEYCSQRSLWKWRSG